MLYRLLSILQLVFLKDLTMCAEYHQYIFFNLVWSCHKFLKMDTFLLYHLVKIHLWKLSSSVPFCHKCAHYLTNAELVRTFFHRTSKVKCTRSQCLLLSLLYLNIRTMPHRIHFLITNCFASLLFFFEFLISLYLFKTFCSYCHIDIIQGF